MYKHFLLTDFKDFENYKDVIVNHIKSGDVGIFPTDTVYGIGALESSEKACNRIYNIKNRPKNKPLPVVVGSLDDFYKIINRDKLPVIVNKIITKWWPGPITIVVERSKGDTVAVRLPDHSILCELIKAVGEPIVLTSANLSGDISPVKIEEISSAVIKEVAFIIDTGQTKYQNESTIVDFKGNVLREGIIKKTEIEDYFIKEHHEKTK